MWEVKKRKTACELSDSTQPSSVCVALLQEVHPAMRTTSDTSQVQLLEQVSPCPLPPQAQEHLLADSQAAENTTLKTSHWISSDCMAWHLGSSHQSDRNGGSKEKIFFLPFDKSADF